MKIDQSYLQKLSINNSIKKTFQFQSDSYVLGTQTYDSYILSQYFVKRKLCQKNNLANCAKPTLNIGQRWIQFFWQSPCENGFLCFRKYRSYQIKDMRTKFLYIQIQLLYKYLQLEALSMNKRNFNLKRTLFHMRVFSQIP